MKRGYISYDLMRKEIKEHIDVAICYNYCRYGHVSKYCQNSTTCYKCGGNPDGRECQASQKVYINCKSLGKEEVQHQARSDSCPVYARRLVLKRSTINYYTDESDNESSENETKESGTNTNKEGQDEVTKET